MTEGAIDDRSADVEAQAEDIFSDAPPKNGALRAVTRATDLTGVVVLKHDELYLLTDAVGDVHYGRHGLGLYDGDTRFLSLYELRINGGRPIVLRTGAGAGYEGTLHLSNADLWQHLPGDDDPEIVLPRHSLGIARRRLLAGSFRERIRIDNFTTGEERARLTLRLDADFADIFEVRGLVRQQRGERLDNRIENDRLLFAYRGLDGALRRTHVRLSPAMTPIEPVEPALEGELLLEADLLLPPGGSQTLEVTVWTELVERGRRPSAIAAPADDERQPAAMHRAWRNSATTIETSHHFAQRALDRGLSDLRLLMNSGPAEGERYIAAGVPWFSTLFGRDSLISALQLLPIRPQVAADTLSVLARLQAQEVDDWRDAQPGKILHELRTGELARAGEIPHTPYFGTVDATPLWLVLLDDYQRWTGDLALVQRLWPNALAALRWIDEFGDADGDGFVEYRRQSRRGLVNQGWKDSGEAIRGRDGTLAKGPIALVEVQGYVYAARRGLARLAGLLGDGALEARQEEAAERLRTRFEEAFWMPDAGTYALALDGKKRQVDALASNAGHALWSGICSPERAASVARTLTEPPMWSGWGIRTLASDTVGYNPIGYHVGSVWPHDNAICAAGFDRYGLAAEARQVAGAMLEATNYFRDSRLPELFCGFDRMTSPQPVPYPVACSPQAWSAGAPFQLVTAALGLRPDADRQMLELADPSLPAWLSEVRIHNLRVGDAVVDLRFDGSGPSVAVEVLRRSGMIDVVVRL